MPVFKAQLRISVMLEKDVTLRIKKGETAEQAAERTRKSLSVPKGVGASGWKLSNVEYDIDVEDNDEGGWECHVSATLVANGPYKVDVIEDSAEDAIEEAESQMFETGHEFATSVFPWLEADEIRGGWEYDDNSFSSEVISVDRYRKSAPAPQPSM